MADRGYVIINYPFLKKDDNDNIGDWKFTFSKNCLIHYGVSYDKLPQNGISDYLLYS